jgi:hypothetical protein
MTGKAQAAEKRRIGGGESGGSQRSGTAVAEDSGAADPAAGVSAAGAPGGRERSSLEIVKESDAAPQPQRAASPGAVWGQARTRAVVPSVRSWQGSRFGECAAQ